MDDAWHLVILLVLIGSLIYGIGVFSERNVLKEVFREPATHLAPYGVRLLHLR